MAGENCRLVKLMREIARTGKSVVVRVDAEREHNLFTLIGPDGRICDTDNPIEALESWWRDESEYPQVKLMTLVIELRDRLERVERLLANVGGKANYPAFEYGTPDTTRGPLPMHLRPSIVSHDGSR